MAKIIYDPKKNHHDCAQELAILDSGHPRPVVGTIAECSCGHRWEKVENQWDGTYWARNTSRIKRMGDSR